MRVSATELQQIYQRLTARNTDADCPGEEALMRIACGEADGGERERVVAHVARCSDCAREYQIARGLRPLRGGVAPNRSILPIAAMLALALVGLAWMALVQQRDSSRIATLRQQLAARPAHIDQPVTPLEPAPALTHIGMPIVDLDPDPTRGSAASVPSVDLARGVDLYTLILHLPSGWGGRIEVAIDSHEPLRASSSNGSLTVTLHRASAGEGKHRIQVRSGKKQIEFPFVVNAH